MDRQFYIENLLDHYENPRNRYKMEDATVSIMGGNPGCGDIVTIYLKVDSEERVIAASFEGEGCTISQAAASHAHRDADRQDAQRSARDEH